ncbi:hypothetical protein [Bifidobacterium sp. UTBIF-78]|uniref:hypothetical protein n=1 Tax=Bifidobacterium sp. UTBIF-78 TaxID=1465263 RepID=UPI0011264C44|nr:hypothetical protein [Bifidobacterium sp. UTBIF-78]TPF94833.1 hypothetical protein BG22_04390 [Bifidobacterium sp. UTBIF-78]
MTDLNNTNAADEPTTPTPNDGAIPGNSAGVPAGGPAHASASGTSPSGSPAPADLGNLDEAWAAFEAEHKADLHDVASSRQARKFEKQAKRREKEALLSVDDLDMGVFTDDAKPLGGGLGGSLRDRLHGGKRTSRNRTDIPNGDSHDGGAAGSTWGDGDNPQRGPRDFTGRSWLDTDDVMDQYDDGGFTPPNPELGPVRTSTALLVALLVIGLAGTIVMVLVPSLYGIPVVSALLNIAFGLCTILGLGGLIVKALNRKDRPGDKGGFYDDGARV